jgi:hypothetical protein
VGRRAAAAALGVVIAAGVIARVTLHSGRNPAVTVATTRVRREPSMGESVALPLPRGEVARDPPAGGRLTPANSTVEFFGGKFIVRIGNFGNDGETVVVDQVVVRLGDYAGLSCQEASVKLGQGVVVKEYVRAGVVFYRVELRGFRARRLELVAQAARFRPSGRLVKRCGVAALGSASTPTPAKARCKDGATSKDDSALDACRRDRGVARWLD